MPSLTATVHGRVQGVGFRYFASRQACALGLAGFARNLPDGTVQVYAEGPRTALEALADALRQGPVASRVTAVDTHLSERVEGRTRFEVE